MKDYLVSYVVSLDNSPVQIDSKVVSCSESLNRRTIEEANQFITDDLERNTYERIANFRTAFSVTILSLTPLEAN